VTLANRKSDIFPITSDQAWELIRDDVTLRLNLIVPELGEEFHPQIIAIYAGERQSDSYYANARVKLELRQMDRRAERYFEACCEAWDVQGRPRSRAFFSAVLRHCLIPLFDLREGFFLHDLEKRHPRLGSTFSLYRGHFKREKGKLLARWANKIEIAMRDNEHQERSRREREGQAPLAPQPPSIVPPAPRGKAKPKRARKKPTTSELHKRATIFAAIQADLEGVEYCSHLDAYGVQIPQPWKGLGCPDSYKTAYRDPDPQWRSKIQDEKYRYGNKKYKKTPASERESMIQRLKRPPASLKVTRPK
jgi:hypothetical protein